jgi:N-hydroxyarylamine O-acetyltransferase
MQAHLLAVPFENLDVQLGVAVSTRPEDAYEKVVRRRRGGWCFELNGLFKWALTEIGFEVQSLAGVVGRVASEPPQEPDHLLLRVDCDEPLFVDVGFG